MEASSDCAGRKGTGLAEYWPELDYSVFNVWEGGYEAWRNFTRKRQ